MHNLYVEIKYSGYINTQNIGNKNQIQTLSDENTEIGSMKEKTGKEIVEVGKFIE